jgi:hypothetical protein
MQILRGRISQDGQDEPSIVLIENQLNLSLSMERIGVGEYKGTLSSPVLNNDNPQKWYIGNSSLCRYSITQITATEFYIQSFNDAGQFADGIISANEFSIEI